MSDKCVSVSARAANHLISAQAITKLRRVMAHKQCIIKQDAVDAQGTCLKSAFSANC